MNPLPAPPSLLPPLYLVTPEPDGARHADEQYLRQLESALRRGVRLVQLRAKTLTPASYRALAIDALACCRRYEAVLLLNAAPELADAIGADGVHLDGARLAACPQRPLDAGKLVFAACHSLQQLRAAEAIGADAATLSPVLPTASHPNAPALGWTAFAAFAAQTALPLYALGGMREDLLAQARVHGAHGVAGIRGFWDSGPAS